MAKKKAAKRTRLPKGEAKVDFTTRRGLPTAKDRARGMTRLQTTAQTRITNKRTGRKQRELVAVAGQTRNARGDLLARKQKKKNLAVAGSTFRNPQGKRIPASAAFTKKGNLRSGVSVSRAGARGRLNTVIGGGQEG